MMKASILLLALVVAYVSADRVFIERSSCMKLPAGWRESDANVDPRSIRLRYVIALKQRNTDQLDSFFWKVSDPQSPIYAQYKTLEELRDWLAPSQSDVNQVMGYLQRHGVNTKLMKLTPSGDFLVFFAPPAVVNAMFDTNIKMYTNDNLKMTVWRSCKTYSAPGHIASKIDFVSGIHHFPVKQGPVMLAGDLASIAVTPSDLRTRYNVTDMADGHTKNQQAVAEFQGQNYSPSDLESFFKQFVPYSTNDTVAGVVPPGSNNPSAPGVEASLDIQYIMSVNPNTPTKFYEQQTFDFWEGMTAWLSLLNSESDVPYVHSISYGEQSEHQTSKDAKTRYNTEFQKLGTRGVSIIFASGDSGVGCTFCVWFEPSFPATSPAVTSVGATTFMSGPPVTPGTQEEAVTAFSSGGGFSWFFDQPSYQSAAVTKWLNEHDDIPSDFHFNKKGRCTPDVAALGWGFQVVNGGETISVGGTSAASPTFAAIMSLLNDQRLKAGKPTLGFLNPWIYQTAASHDTAFFDVVVGSNPDGCCGKGFKCAPGYDPVTGVGTPNYEVLKTLLP